MRTNQKTGLARARTNQKTGLARARTNQKTGQTEAAGRLPRPLPAEYQPAGPRSWPLPRVNDTFPHNYCNDCIALQGRSQTPVCVRLVSSTLSGSGSSRSEGMHRVEGVGCAVHASPRKDGLLYATAGAVGSPLLHTRAGSRYYRPLNKSTALLGINRHDFAHRSSEHRERG